ncbi:MAG: ATP phosphoribosyltransferase [Planctomycetota bacterium]
MAKKIKCIKLALPKGSLEQSTLELLRKAGWKVRVEARSYYPPIDDDEISCIMLRPQEMPRYIERGKLDAGICGKDWVIENDADVQVIADLVYSKHQLTPVCWVLAVPDNSPIQSVRDLQGCTIATELVNTTKKYLAANGVQAKVEFSHGATEVKPPELADAIVDVTETGSSLKANNLRIVARVCESVTQLIANKAAYQVDWKREKLENIGMLMQGAIRAQEMVGLKMNVPAHCREAVMAKLEALSSPTISPLAQEGWIAAEVVIAESRVRKLVPELQRSGATGIIEYPLNKIIP